MGLTNFIRSFKLTYVLNNLLNYSKLKQNKTLYKKYGLKKPVWANISSKDFEGLPQQAPPKFDTQSLKTIADKDEIFLAFSENVQKSIINWSEDGYLILPEFFVEQADAVNEEISQLQKNGTINFRYGNKLMFALKHSELMRSVGKDPEILKILSFLMGKEAQVFQSINFLEGSQQKAHSDTVHMTTYPKGYLIAIWVALEDIEEEQGALFYYPGSHKLPYILKEDFEHGGNSMRLGANAYKAYEDRIEKLIEEEGLEKKIFKAKKGDVLIWHANLLHGGGPVTKEGASRKSMVFHYFAKGVICYHEITERPAIIESY